MNNINGLTSASAELDIANTVDLLVEDTIDSPTADTIDLQVANTAAVVIESNNYLSEVIEQEQNICNNVPCKLTTTGYGNSKIKITAKYKKTKKNIQSKISPLTLSKKIENMHVEIVTHGGWTINKAKNRLKEFIKSIKIMHYNTSSELIKSSRIYVAEMSIFIEKLNKTITSCEVGVSRKTAKKRCILSMISELCFLGQIEHCLSAQQKNEIKHPKTRKTRKTPKTPKTFSVDVNGKLMNDVYSLLEDLKIKPVFSKNCGTIRENGTLIIKKDPEQFNKSNINSYVRNISWSPPEYKWNPWSSTKIYVHDLKSLKKLSNSLEIEMANKRLHSHEFLKRTENRTSLPIFVKKDEILNAINIAPIIIIRGESGCGKTTQICQFILDDYIQKKKGAHCNIICTQTTKISAMTVANRVAFERAEYLGESVGFSAGSNTIYPRPFGAIFFCTTEHLIDKLKKGLNGITHIIVDDVHERRAGTVFLLTILKDMIQKYPDLKLIVTSINKHLLELCLYLKDFKMLNVPGQCYPVKEYFLEDIVQLINFKQSKKDISQWKPMQFDINCNKFVSADFPPNVRNSVSMLNENGHNLRLIKCLLSFIENQMKIEGAVLIFLPGLVWISKLKDYLLKIKRLAEKLSILTFHSKLSYEDQYKVFEPNLSGKRKIILSTNIAASAITIDDVVFVIDYGKVNSFECFDDNVEFKTVWASKMNVEQRKGRIGRCKDGYYFKLFSKEQFSRFNDNVESELTYCSLTNIALTIKLLQLGDIHTFLKKAIKPPSDQSLENVTAMLKELKCLTTNGELTALGTIVASIPIEPQFARMMVLGNLFMLGDALSIISASSSIALNYYSLNDRFDHNFSGNRFSDHLSFLNAFIQWKQHSANYDFISSSESDKICHLQNKLKYKFQSFGFPDHCFEKQNFDFGETKNFNEPKLDVLPALLTMAFYPNVYIQKKKGKAHFKNNDVCMVHNKSVNYPKVGSENQLPFPFFIYQIRSHKICMKSTMVTPIHLLLFGARDVDYIDGLIVLDNWINLKMDVAVAAAIVALRPAIDELILRVAENPRLVVNNLSATDNKLIKIIQDLCDLNAGRNNLPPVTFKNSE